MSATTRAAPPPEPESVLVEAAEFGCRRFVYAGSQGVQVRWCPGGTFEVVATARGVLFGGQHLAVTDAAGAVRLYGVVLLALRVSRQLAGGVAPADLRYD